MVYLAQNYRPGQGLLFAMLRKWGIVHISQLCATPSTKSTNNGTPPTRPWLSSTWRHMHELLNVPDEVMPAHEPCSWAHMGSQTELTRSQSDRTEWSQNLPNRLQTRPEWLQTVAKIWYLAWNCRPGNGLWTNVLQRPLQLNAWIERERFTYIYIYMFKYTNEYIHI